MIIITVTESKKQIIKGLPEFVTVETSVPATIFYTTDGSEPDVDSQVYVDKIYLDLSTAKSQIKILAVGATEVSETLDLEWSVEIPNYDKTALTGKEGINILPPNKEVVDSLAFDTDGSAQRSTSIGFVDLDIQASTANEIGEEIPDGSSIPFIRFPIVEQKDESIISSTDSIYFNPKAKLILVDGFAGFDDQEIRIINRPHSSMDATSDFYRNKEHWLNEPSGDFVNYFYNPKTKKIVLYYREYLDNRWMISTQKTDIAKLNLTPKGNPFVFQWITERSQSRLF